jgi:hypothetical protein
MNQEINDKLKQIKQSFRLMMNGEASRSMRQRGVDYKLNWGVPVPMLKDMAKEFGKDYALAIELWKEDIRECKILAILIMPADEMPPEIVDIWMEQTKNQELAEIGALYLYQYLDYAPVIAYEWIAKNAPIYQICGYQILARLFMNGQEPNERGINEFLDQASVDLLSDNSGVRHAVLSCVGKFVQLGDDYEIIARNALKPLNLNIF